MMKGPNKQSTTKKQCFSNFHTFIQQPSGFQPVKADVWRRWENCWENADSLSVFADLFAYFDVTYDDDIPFEWWMMKKLYDAIAAQPCHLHWTTEPPGLPSSFCTCSLEFFLQLLHEIALKVSVRVSFPITHTFSHGNTESESESMKSRQWHSTSSLSLPLKKYNTYNCTIISSIILTSK